ncbi:MAG TPA: hypothetical protein VKV80_05430 [Streptosporangiaceae bacterium]|nr:hypothetical protein [Streptosporangiaceae bacterium]
MPRLTQRTPAQAPEDGSTPRPPRQAPDGRRLPPPDPAVRQRGWAALAMGLLSLIGLSLVGDMRRAVYVVALTLLIGAAAAWLGVSAMRRARRAGTARPGGAVGGTVLGVIGLAFSALTLLAFAVFWRELSAYSSCMNGANTIAAQQACQQQLSRSFGIRITGLRPPAG